MNTEADSILSRGDEIGGYVYKEVDYCLLKLFFLSLLWRAHHSSHDLFSGVNVGRRMERRLRELILAGNPSRADEFAVVLARFDDELSNGFLHPFHERYHGAASVESHCRALRIRAYVHAQARRGPRLAPLGEDAAL